jgi:hypothetical protein
MPIDANAAARHYIVLTPSPELRQIYFEDGPIRGAIIRTQAFLDDVVTRNNDGVQIKFRVVDLPSRRIRPIPLSRRPINPDQRPPADGYAGQRERSQEIPPVDMPGRIVIVLEFIDPQDVAKFVAALHRAQLAPDLQDSVDLPIAVADHWCPGYGPQSLFSDRPEAEVLLRATGVRSDPIDHAPFPVNVVMIDEGLQEARIPPNVVAAGGWAVDARLPYQAKSAHGSMVMRNALSFATDVTLWDFPLLPDLITDLDAFLSLAQASFELLKTLISVVRAIEAKFELQASSWIFVNAWGVYNTTQDVDGKYSRNTDNCPLHTVISEIEAMKVDIVFAAGNCGEFCPSPRCGPNDRGPGLSIQGVNSHPKVLTVAAVRADGVWLGYSSQGPGQILLSADKPDVCAPSQFGESADSSPLGSNTGTSAACGMASGIVVAMRNRVRPSVKSPGTIRDLLRETAWPPQPGPQAGIYFGRGVIDAKAAIELL